MNGVLQPDLHADAGPALLSGHWMQVLSHLQPRYGGISTVVPELVRALSGQGIRSNIEAFSLAGEEYYPSGMQSDAVHFWPLSRFAWFRDATLRSRFEASLRQADGVHVHGLWDTTSATTSGAARQWKKPYLLSSHGMLEPWALQHGKLKKQIYSALIERDVVRNASCLHALTPAEALQYRSYAGVNKRTVVIPNGVSIPKDRSSELFFQKYPDLRDRRIVLFLARLHMKKGVDLLLRAWKGISSSAPDAVLVLAGPDSDGLSATLQEESAAQNTQDSIVFTGMLGPEMKWSALAAAECMVLPSHSEGLSMSVLEAMGAGVPVLLTPQCNMPWIAQIGAGWLTEPATDAIREALVHVLSLSREANRNAGALGASFIQQNYSWSSVAERMAEAYRWCLGGNTPVLSEVVS